MWHCKSQNSPAITSCTIIPTDILMDGLQYQKIDFQITKLCIIEFTFWYFYGKVYHNFFPIFNNSLLSFSVHSFILITSPTPTFLWPKDCLSDKGPIYKIYMLSIVICLRSNIIYTLMKTILDKIPFHISY